MLRYLNADLQNYKNLSSTQVTVYLHFLQMFFSSGVVLKPRNFRLYSEFQIFATLWKLSLLQKYNFCTYLWHDKTNRDKVFIRILGTAYTWDTFEKKVFGRLGLDVNVTWKPIRTFIHVPNIFTIWRVSNKERGWSLTH